MKSNNEGSPRETALRKEVNRLLPDATQLVIDIEAKQQALKRVVSERWRKDEGVVPHERDEDDTVLSDSAYTQTCEVIDDLGAIAAIKQMALFMGLPEKEIDQAALPALSKIFNGGTEAPKKTRNGHVGYSQNRKQ